MSRKVNPLNVSPVIRSARYISLFCGMTYGLMKMSALKAYEASAKPKRDKIIRENHERHLMEELTHMREEIKNIVDQMDLPDVPPNWELDIK